MKKIIRYLKRLMIPLSARKSWKLVKVFLTISMLLLTLPMISYAQVKAIDYQTASLTQKDLHELVTQVVENKAESLATKEALKAERALFDSYVLHVDQLIEVQKEERKSMLDALKKKLFAPSIEVYGGYSIKNEWEGGIRLIWKLR